MLGQKTSLPVSVSKLESLGRSELIETFAADIPVSNWNGSIDSSRRRKAALTNSR